jgi:stage II sporulation protein AB (anti-sigma F factor)
MKKARYSGAVINKMQLKLPALSANEGMARAAVAAFCAQLDPAAVEIADVKCAVSEAVTNCIVHAYRGTVGTVTLMAKCYEDRTLRIIISDKGCGIEDVAKARTPLFTTCPDEDRCGMGFSIMESFSDKLSVVSKKGSGTRITMTRRLSPSAEKDT